MAQTTSVAQILLDDPETPELYKNATQSAFLRLAGQGKLSKDGLAQWLAQDRLYAQAYARFIGGLISRVQLPSRQEESVLCAETLEWRILVMLQDALQGIMRELEFFEKTAAAFGLDIAAHSNPNDVTAKYKNLFGEFFAGQQAGSKNRTLGDGLLLLWATEKCYLDAWTYAKEQKHADGNVEEHLDGGALRKEFIPNWTSKDFKKFVKEIQECVDAYFNVSNPEEAFMDGVRDMWKTALELEKDFWPKVEE